MSSRRALALGVAAVLAIATCLDAARATFQLPPPPYPLSLLGSSGQAPFIDGQYRFVGLEERAEILRDAYGVPHIYAANTHDLFFLQGFVTAQDRLFQMDLLRRVGRGRVAEVLGEGALETDRMMRTLGLAAAAAGDLLLVRADTRAALEAYAAGVNKAIGRSEAFPMEFMLLGYRPEQWSALDSLAIARVQAWDLATNYTTELLRADIALRIGEAPLASLFPDPEPLAVGSEQWRAVAPYLAAARDPLPVDAPSDGSNCWAAAASRTVKGSALLAADPHLPARNPATWYEIGLEGAGIRAVGFSLPGIPGILMGHNAQIAWGLTNAYLDVQDLYVERRHPSDPHQFLFGESYERAAVSREEIRVRGRAEPVPLEVVRTRHGPIVSATEGGAALALRWTSLQPGRSGDAILSLLRAEGWESFRRALADLQGPPVVVCYADVHGRVGLLAAGEIPLRAAGHDGRLPAPGWTGTYEWRGSSAAQESAAEFDPASGIVISANQRIGGGAGYSGEHDPGYRAARLRELLEGASALDAERFRVAQTDVLSLPARALRAALLALPARGAAAEGATILRDWDGAMREDSAGAALYHTWLVRMSERAFADRLGGDLYARYARHGRFVVPAVLAMFQDGGWFPSGTARDAAAAEALASAMAELMRSRGAPDRWRWGDLHAVRFTHVLSAAPPLRLVLDIGPVSVGGDRDTVAKAAYRYDRPFAVSDHASLRMIVDLGDLDASWSVLPTGQSGQPFSPHWGDQTALWEAGKLHPMRYSRERLGTLEGVLVLRPR